MQTVFPRLVMLVTVAAQSGAVVAQDATPVERPSEALSFSRDVRPILSQHCFACHGPDENTREAGVRLDQPGEVDLAEMRDRITDDNSDFVMPPPHHNKPLTPEKIATLITWTEAGAPYERHWSFVPPVQAAVPSDQHPIDFFVDRRLEAEGMKRSPPADPALLIRRLYLDLIGIPPTIPQADAFIEDPSEENYTAIVDQLLRSPQYGEHWAARWLDLARYADTNGYEKDRDRTIWPYRDWVIRAINDGMPFDQFTIEQLAGDMLPDPSIDQLIATGFHRNTMLNEEGGIDPLEYRYYAMTDRVATTGTTWLGLTTGCAQCHTHKFDPITHDDYFGIMAYLNNADEPDLFFHTEDSRRQWQADQQRLKKLIADLKSHWPDDHEQGETVASFDDRFSAWLDVEAGNQVEWTTVIPHSMTTNLPHLSLEADGIIIATGDTTKRDDYQLNFPALAQPVTAFRLEVLPDRDLPGGGPGLTFYEGRKGDFFLAEIDVVDGENQKIPWSAASDTFAANQFGNHRVAAELATDGDIQTGWSIAGRNGFRHVAVFNLQSPIPAGSEFTMTMSFGRHFASSLGKFRLSVANSDHLVRASILQADEVAMLKRADAARNPHLQHLFLMQAEPVETFADEIRRLQHPQQGLSTLVMRERQAGISRPTWFRHRGEFTQPRYQVSPRLPEAIFDPEKSALPGNRLEFAQWLVSRDNPLTARVTINRHWQAFFGTGIVETVDDFGMQGAPPTHPQLLDWLAVELMETGWSIKALHRQIVTSQTYRQSSKTDADQAGAATLLQRFPRSRLEAEVIRDSALAASGLLNLKPFGPPIRPVQPEGAAANYAQSQWQPSEPDERFRRSVYIYQKRTAPFAMLTTFDASSREFCVAQRNASNTPLQALTLMNDPMFMEIAEAFGNVMAAEQGHPETRIIIGFRRILTRQPDDAELIMLKKFYAKHQDWQAVARVLLCLDEAITKN